MMLFLQQLMHDVNPFVAIFKQAHEILKQAKNANQKDCAIVIDADNAPDPRTFNLPTK